jgi:hypothetical protein
MFTTAAGGQTSLDYARKKGGKVAIVGLYATPPNAEDESTLYQLGWMIDFEAIPLTPGSVEVRGTCYTSGEDVEAVYLELLAMIGARWPESGLAAMLAPDVDDAPAVIGGEVAPDKTRKGRRRSKDTDDNARDAQRLYQQGLTQAEIAERKLVTEKTVQRWLKRAANWEKTQTGTQTG